MPNTVGLLDDAVALLERAVRLEDVQETVRTTARRLVGADGVTFVLLEGDKCYYADEDSMSPLWKGQRFPAASCISGWAMTHRETVAIRDIRVDERIPQEAYRPTFVRSLLMVPMLSPEQVGAVGAVGAYWAGTHMASDQEIATLEKFAGFAGQAVVRFPQGVPAPGVALLASEA